jgi:electron transfer flavoprotein alpha subunit
MSVLVFADSNNNKITKSSFETIFYGKKLAQQLQKDCLVVTYGNIDQQELSSLGNFGAKKVFIAKSLVNSDNQHLTKLISKVVAENNVDVIVFSHDISGKSLAARTAANIGAGIVSGAISMPDTSNGFVIKKAVFSGKAFAEVEITTPKKVISLLPNSFQVEKTNDNAEVIEISFDATASNVKVKEVKQKGGKGILLNEAELVVSAGRGLKGPENWGMIEELAKELGAATACSRPVADIGWRPHHEHVGQTGVAIRPNLYIAVGISGAIQHLAGVNGSKVIVVINTDKEAPFFKAADYGIIGDAFEVVPKLIEAFKKFKAANN